MNESINLLISKAQIRGVRYAGWNTGGRCCTSNRKLSPSDYGPLLDYRGRTSFGPGSGEWIARIRGISIKPNAPVQSFIPGGTMSYWGHTKTVLDNKYFKIKWHFHAFAWETKRNKTFAYVPDGTMTDPLYVLAVMKKYWNDGRITEDHAITLFEKDIKDGKYNRPVSRRGNPDFRWRDPPRPYVVPEHFIVPEGFQSAPSFVPMDPEVRARIEAIVAGNLGPSCPSSLAERQAQHHEDALRYSIPQQDPTARLTVERLREAARFFRSPADSNRNS